jgi:hypothetical protein
MLSGVMLLWFLLTAMAVIFVAWDIRSTPESPVLKAGFVLLTCYTGPLGAFLYVLGCREPLPGLHEQYISVRWRQVLGSTMHCVAGDGVGILAGAVIGAWMIFQALFMRDMAGGSYGSALRSAFLPELLSMNFLMAGMTPVMTLAMKVTPNSHNPLGPTFWFVMSMALLTGFIVAYPMNWWLVANHLKHGMMTVRKRDQAEDNKSIQAHGMDHHGATSDSGHTPDTPTPLPNHKSSGHTARQPSAGRKGAMTLLSFAVFGVGLAIAWVFGGFSS